MADRPFEELSRRERQIMEVVYAEGEVSVGDVRERIPEPPSYSAVRSTLRILEGKGHVRHRQDGPRYLYRATVPVGSARRAALERLVGTFFDGSVEDAAVALLGLDDPSLSGERLERLAERIEDARKEGR
jgi:predicted transcriptional regulator